MSAISPDPSDPIYALPTVFTDNEDQLRARMLAAVPDRLSKIEGAWARDALEVAVLELTRIRQEMNLWLAYTFPQFAFGPILDAHAAAYGLTRGVGTRASVRIRFVAPEGTLIPAAAVVEAPAADPDAERIRFATLNVAAEPVPAAGYVEIDARALNVGLAFNVPTGAVTLPDTDMPDVTEITNPLPAVGGTDPEDDVTLRARVMQQAALPVGGGSQLDYVVLATDTPTVGSAAVAAAWDASSTSPPSATPVQLSVLISVRDPRRAPVDWSVVQERQIYIDPARQLLAIFEDGEPWTLAPIHQVNTVDFTGTVSSGTYTLTVDGETTAAIQWNAAAAAVQTALEGLPGIEPGDVTVTGGPGPTDMTVTHTDATPHTMSATSSLGGGGSVSVTTAVALSSAPAMSWVQTAGQVQMGRSALQLVTGGSGWSGLRLVRGMNLSRFTPSDELFIWLQASAWGDVNSSTRVRFYDDDSNYFEATLATVSTSGTAKPGSGAAWWLWRVSKSQLTAVGAPSWSAISSVELRVLAGANVTVRADYWSIRSPNSETGKGKASIGHAVTVTTPVPRAINVAATLSVIATGYTLSGAPGTTDITALIKSRLEQFLLDLLPGAPVRLKDIENVIHDTPGVVDFTGVQLNGGTSNIAITLNEHAVLGSLTLS